MYWGGGYKYLQWGEGNGFLRFPKTCMLRPALTGWLASFEEVSQGAGAQKEISYDTGNMRFSGATYDPSSQFRAARVVDFFREQQLSGEKLRDQYQAQLAYMQAQFLTLHCAPEQLKLLHDVPATQRGGFLALQSPKASEICVELHKAGDRICGSREWPLSASKQPLEYGEMSPTADHVARAPP